MTEQTTMRVRWIPLYALLLALPLVACGDDSITPPQDGQEPEDGFLFSYTPPPGAPPVNTIAVRGDFNDWDSSPMKARTDGSWDTRLDIADGTYEYKFYINQSWPADMCHDQTWGHPDADYWIDPDAAGCVDDGHGGQNAVAVVGESAFLLSHDSADPAHVSAAGDRLSVRFRATADRVETATLRAGGESYVMHHQLTVGLEEVWRAAVPSSVTEYELVVETADGSETFGPYTAPGDPFTAVPWVRDGVGYQIFPERFWNGDPSNDSAALATDVVHYMDPAVWSLEPELTQDWSGPIGESHCCHQYFGGDLQGIIDRLDHLEALGVTLLYLNPIFTSGSAHGYDTYDYLEVAPNFGDSTVLRQLMTEAEARGMRIMWDFVPNHVGVGFWAFQDAVENGESSDYWQWFNFHVPASEIQVGNGNHYDAWWGIGELPRLETRNDTVMEHLLEVTRHWTAFGLEGIRVDVPMEIRNRSEFFTAFRQAAKEVDPDVYLIAEVWERDASWLQGDQFDALMNYALGEGAVEPFAAGHTTGTAAARTLAQLYALYPEAATAMLFNLISSHDTPRLLTQLGGGSLGDAPSDDALAKQRLASAMLYALPGVPVTFQGDECAFLGSQENDEHRYPFQWGSCDAEMLAHYQQLATLRGELSALESPAFRSHQASSTLLSFYRGEPGPGEVLVVLNSGTEAATFELPEGSWSDAVADQAATGSVEVEPRGWLFLLRG